MIRDIVGSQPVPYVVGNHYRTTAGDMVRFVTVSSEGTSYETMADESGIHRYTRRDFGRVTGSPHDYSDPRNVPPLFAAPIGNSDELTVLALANARREGVESAAKLLDKRCADYVEAHGLFDPETGTTELPGTGDEYVGELMEIAEQIRASIIRIDPARPGGDMSCRMDAKRLPDGTLFVENRTHARN